jgi:hypothetical protein
MRKITISRGRARAPTVSLADHIHLAFYESVEHVASHYDTDERSAVADRQAIEHEKP